MGRPFPLKIAPFMLRDRRLLDDGKDIQPGAVFQNICARLPAPTLFWRGLKIHFLQQAYNLVLKSV